MCCQGASIPTTGTYTQTYSSPARVDGKAEFGSGNVVAARKFTCNNLNQLPATLLENPTTGALSEGKITTTKSVTLSANSDGIYNEYKSNAGCKVSGLSCGWRRRSGQVFKISLAVTCVHACSQSHASKAPSPAINFRSLSQAVPCAACDLLHVSATALLPFLTESTRCIHRDRPNSEHTAEPRASGACPSHCTGRAELGAATLHSGRHTIDPDHRGCGRQQQKGFRVRL